ncbi:MAG: Wzz/FepE/Etk N-terminal domain-containing protein [Aminobacterium sp.]|mgnify:CR=1 FL=1|nr:Wzz/FepE/Etk N-terminal domain-containing protein [Bacteroides sp.]
MHNFDTLQEEHLPNKYEREEDEIDLLDLVLVLLKNKWLIIGVTFLFVCIAIVTSLMMTPIYRASTSFIQTPTGTTLSSKLIIDVTKNTQILDAIIDKFSLQNDSASNDKTTARHLLRGKATIQDQSGIFYLSILDTNPERAAAIANYWIEELQNKLNSLQKEQMTIITTQSVGIKEELDEVQNLLSEKTKALGTYFEQINIPIETKQELQILKSSADKEASPLVLKELPDGGAEYMLRIREIRTAENQYLLLLNKFNSLKDEEMQRPTIIQVVQQAFPPDQRIRPRCSLIVISSLFLGLFIGILLAFAVEFVHNAKNDQERHKKITMIRALLWKNKNTQ